ncbi:TPM domain-containing protein [Sorangium sp. So ce406]|uniref:TPM domain-containing protein n=1 Tax=Sorangium sp. So ce406 TaxID=3133311 RepID=UPI003F5BD671
MATKSFFDDDARARVKTTVAAIERQTSAEIVVAVRPRSGHYRQADYLAGAITGFVALLLLLFLPQSFTVDTMPLDVLGAFAIGAVLSANASPLRRLLLPRKLLDDSVRTAARASFVDCGVSRTEGRSGVLVFVSTFERRVAVVADVGVEAAQPGEAYEQAVRALEGSLRAGLDPDRFLAALEALGPALSAALPRAVQDVNELSDDLDVAA